MVDEKVKCLKGAMSKIKKDKEEDDLEGPGIRERVLGLCAAHKINCV